MTRWRRTGVRAMLASAALVMACRDRPSGAAPRADAAAPASSVARIEVTRWLGMDPYQLGCSLERTLGRTDARYGCSAPRRPPPSDPCDPAWSDGPAIQPDLARNIHPLLRAVELDWEHGALQRILFGFAPGVADADLPRLLGVRAGALEAAAGYGPGTCETPCYEVVVFEEGEDECAEEEDEGG
ncbi:MAG TPA: hypothetical protein VF904_11335 [Anaeromyxobacteraceae bacterium]